MGQDEFTQRWIVNLIESMDENLDEKTRMRLLESCGRACARSSAIKAAEACKGDLDKLLSTLGKWVGKENVRKDNGTVYVSYSKCLCHLVAEGPARLPDTYCFCSRGWLKEMFETVVGRPVDVDLKESIKRGGKKCRFTIRL